MRKNGLKLLLGAAASLPITAYSLGLGEIDVKSFLNQPLRAEIEIISARSGEIDDLIVRLANREAFSRASLSRPSFLSDLKFKIINKGDGLTPKVLVTTRTAVKEPVLNFLVDADWSKGKVIREFTVLLDPPYIAQQIREQQAQQQAKNSISDKAATPKSSAIVDTVTSSSNNDPKPEYAQSGSVNAEYVNESAIQDESSSLPVTQSKPIAMQSQESSEQATSTSSSSMEQDTITVADGQTLWSVATSIRPEGMSMSQVMLALQSANPDAFGRNNINNLKKGSVLRVPTVDEMNAWSKQDAYQEVLQQKGLWNEYLASIGHASPATMSSNSGSNSGKSANEESSDKQGNLSLVAVEEGDSDQAALETENNVDVISKLKKQLLLSEEETDSLKLENDELLARVKALEEQLSKTQELDNLVTVKDDTLAVLEQNLANEADESANQQTSMEEASPQQINEEVEPEASTETPDSIVAEESITQETNDEMSATDTVEVDQSQSEQPTMDDMAQQEAMPESIQPELESQEQEPVIKTPIIVSESKPSGGLVDDIIKAVMSNPIVQGAIAGILLLVLLLIKMLKGRKSNNTEAKESDAIEDTPSEDPVDTQSGIIIPNVDEDETPINVPKMEEEQPMDGLLETQTGLAADDDEEDQFSATAILSADDMAPMLEEAQATTESSVEETAEIPIEPEQDETLDEVDVYLAYSLFDNAEELLTEKLNESPERADYRAKLLDTYFAMQNKDSFNEQANILQDLGDAAKPYWARVQAMGFELDSSNPLYAEGADGDVSDLTIAKPDSADFDIGADMDDTNFDLSLDGEDTNFDLSEDNSDSDTSDSDDGLEFNLDDLSDDDETEIRGEKAEGSEDEELPDELGSLDFDLDLDDSVSSDTVSNDEVTDDDLQDDVSIELDDDEIDEEISLDADKNDEAVDMDIDLDSMIESDEQDAIDDITDESLDIDINDESDDLVEIESGDSDDISFEETSIMPAIEEDLTGSENNEDDIVDISLDDIDQELDISNDDLMDDNQNVELDLSESGLDVEQEATEATEIIETDATAVIPELNLDDTESDDVELDISSTEPDNIEMDISDVSDDDVDLVLSDDLKSDDDDDVILDLSEDIESLEELPEQLATNEVAPDTLNDTSEELDVDLDDMDIDVGLDDLDGLDQEDITDINNIEELMLPDDVDEIATKLDLAKAFIDMGDSEGARSSLEEVMSDGSDEQKSEAQELLNQIS